jgi:hypothetical protein
MTKHFPRFSVVAAGLALLIIVASPQAQGCSICRCGDPTFNSLGTDVYQMGAFRISLDWERFEKEKGFAPGEGESLASGEKEEGHDDSEETGRENITESRLTTGFSYAFGERVIAVARIPWASRRTGEVGGSHHEEEAVSGEEANSSKALGDPEFYALVRLWASDFSGGLGRRAWVSALGGVKTNWAKNDLTEEGHRLDEELQAGTGSTDWFGGLSGLYLLDQRSALFSSVQYRRPGTSKFHYRSGDTILANLGYEHKLARLWDGVVELNFRDADRDKINEEGTIDPHTGGRLIYVTPRVMVDLGKGLVGRLAVQVPIYRDLNGTQREKAVANFGFTYLF